MDVSQPFSNSGDNYSEGLRSIDLQNGGNEELHFIEHKCKLQVSSDRNKGQGKGRASQELK